MNKETELRVFISSTFRDLHKEREHLIKKIFPEIRSLCRERGVTFTEVDLRWGLTEEEDMLGRIIRTCLEEVDRCRPYFIGMIGDRYGWIPEYHQILMDPDLLLKYPWIDEVVLEGASLTEMEFIHGVFNAPEADAGSAFFYRRTGDISETDNPERLAALIERSRATGHSFREFRGVDELGQRVHDDLLGMIDRYWPEAGSPSTLELERRPHRAFAASRTRAYILDPEHLKAFTRWINEGEKPLVVRGESGLGKSSLVAYLAEHYRTKHPTALVIEHYVGASERSGSPVSVMQHLVEEIRERFGIDEELPTKEEELERSFSNWLFRCEHLAIQAGVQVLIVLDALNQLDESGRRLTWLPKTIPLGVKLIVSTTPGEADDRLAEREWEELTVAPLEDEGVRQSIIVRYLGEFHKGISVEGLRRVIIDRKAMSPLYLRVVAEELRLHGKHETLDTVIDHYTGANELLEVFEQVLERMEGDYGELSVRDLLSLIGVSRSGLSETDLLELTGMSRLDLSRLLFALDYHLIHRDGLLGFFHDYLRRAVVKRYFADAQTERSMRLRLAEYLENVLVSAIDETGNAPRRMAVELPYQLHGCEAWGRLVVCLATIPVFMALYKEETQYDVLAYWSALGTEYDVEAAYRDGLERWGYEEGEERSRALGRVANLLERLGRWEGAIALERERLASAIERGDRTEEAAAHRGLGWLLQLRGEYGEAFDELARARDLYTELEDRRELSHVIGNMGVVYSHQGVYDAALECYQQHEAICGELGDHRGLAQAISDVGTVYCSRGEYNAALECYQKTESICRELGDRRGLCMAIGNMGIVYYRHGEYNAALDSYRQCETICRELGNRHGLSLAVGSMGIVYRSRGEYDAALECYRQKETICRELSDRRGLSFAIGNIGVVYADRGEYDAALECYRQQESICCELSDRHGLSIVIGNIGHVYSSRGEFATALECYRQQEAICRELGDCRGLFLAIGNMGGVYSSREEYDTALRHLHHAAEEHRAIGDRYLLSTWLQETTTVLLEVAATAKEMPEYLPTYLPTATAATWQTTALQRAREHAEECIDISEQLQKPDTLFGGCVLLARLDAADGNLSEACEGLVGLLEKAGDDEQRAELHYWLWNLILGSSSSDGVGSRSKGEEHRIEALKLYTTLYTKTPKHTYRTQIESLSAGAENTTIEMGDTTE
jgi:tetratricopeptide (TPR) repeat protein